LKLFGFGGEVAVSVIAVSSTEGIETVYLGILVAVVVLLVVLGKFAN
jgi:hypothetical protein